MITLLYILGWYLIGLITAILGTKIADKNIKVKDIPFILGVALIGPFLIFIFLITLAVNLWIDFMDIKPFRKVAEYLRENRDKILW